MKPAYTLTALLLIALTSFAGLCQARQEPAAVRSEVSRLLRQQTISLPGEVSIQVGEFAADNALPPCVQLEAFLPPGARAWGRVSVGVRCLAPSPWSAWVPAEVRVKGLYLVTTGPLTAGQLIGPGDIRREAGELTALAASHLRLPPAVVQGQPVKVVTRGGGFQVTNDGTALSTAGDGQAAQVRLGSGQVLRGTARSGGVVEVTLP